MGARLPARSSTATPTPGWLQILSPPEALIGLGLLTASVAWLLQTYPVLSRRRALAYEIHLLVDTERRLALEVPDIDPGAASNLYGELVARLGVVERDLVDYPIVGYFVVGDARFSLTAAIPHLADLADRGAAPDSPPAVHLRAAMLQQAIEDLSGSTRAA